MGAIERVEAELLARPRKWLVTGAAGFIGSHLAGRLLSLGQQVVALDNFETGSPKNLDAIVALADPQSARRLHFIEGDIRKLEVCRAACAGVEVVLHEAGLASVPRSLEDPLSSHEVNVGGFLNLLVAARDAGVGRFVYASSHTVYGDLPAKCLVEETLGEARSPHALSKRIDELYARSFQISYGLESIGLRYFNVFGPRQDSSGANAAVIPRWVAALRAHAPVVIYGDGETSRDFCYVENVVQANLLAGAAARGSEAVNQLYNVGAGAETTLNLLFEMIRDRLAVADPPLRKAVAAYQAFRPGDVKRSRADISKARRLLGYAPGHSVASGLDETLAHQAGTGAGPARVLRAGRQLAGHRSSSPGKR
jgi:UDP-N-acetylglucosamine 4-epimerase